MYMYVCMHMYIYREREREREIDIYTDIYIGSRVNPGESLCEYIDMVRSSSSSSSSK